MKRNITSLGRLDALIAKTEEKIAEQVIRFKTAKGDTRTSNYAARRLAVLRFDLAAYQAARNAIAASHHSSNRSESLSQ